MLQSTRVIMKISTILTLFIAVFLFLYQTDAAAEEKDAVTVAVLPFEMHAPSSLAYLQDGLRDMLASRLAANGGAKIIERSKIDALLKEPGKILQQKEAVELARQLGCAFSVAHGVRVPLVFSFHPLSIAMPKTPAVGLSVM